MPNVSPSTYVPGRASDRLLTLWLAIAVSYLFSVLPFGNPRVGYMPPMPGPLSITAPVQTPQISSGALLTDALSWDADCQVVWATLNDVTPKPLPAATAGTARPIRGPACSGVRPDRSQRPPPHLSRLLYSLRAPPRVA